MNKKILAVISVILTLTMLLGFAGCQSEGEEQVTYAVKTPLSIENRTEIDDAGAAHTLPTYSPEEVEINTTDIFAYIQTILPELKEAEAGVKIGLSKGIVKAKNEKDEELPYSDNDTLNAVVNTLSKHMLITGPTEENKDGGYVGMDKTGQLVVFNGESAYGKAELEKVIPFEHIGSLTRENVEKAICVDEGPLRIVTITLKDAFPPEMVQNIYNQGIAQDDIKTAVLAELATADDFMKAVEPENIGVSYDNCQLVITINLETDEITAIEYIKRANISTKVVGIGTMEGLKETPLNFCYESFLKYEIDRNNPADAE